MVVEVGVLVVEVGVGVLSVEIGIGAKGVLIIEVGIGVLVAEGVLVIGGETGATIICWHAVVCSLPDRSSVAKLDKLLSSRGGDVRGPAGEHVVVVVGHKAAGSDRGVDRLGLNEAGGPGVDSTEGSGSTSDSSSHASDTTSHAPKTTSHASDSTSHAPKTTGCSTSDISNHSSTYKKINPVVE